MALPAELNHQVVMLVAEVCDANPDDIDVDAPLVDYGLDSLNAVELAITLEDAFGIDIPNDVAARLTSSREIVEEIRAQREESRHDVR